jgi:malonyl-CoA O-methyltransferase
MTVASDPMRVDASVATVRRQFSARAARFARHDAVVRETGRRLIERLEVIRHPVQRILDLGCGSGACREALLERFPRARWLGIDLSEAMLRAGRPAQRSWLRRLAQWPVEAAARRERPDAGLRVCASAERLPLADASVDLVFSNLMLHWHPEPHAVVREIARVLPPGGLVLFSSYGPDTLLELREACRQALAQAAPMPYVDMHDLGDMLVEAGFEAPVMEAEVLTLTYRDPLSLVREVRGLGGNPRNDRPRALPSGRRARALLQALERGADAQGRIGLRFEIVIGHGWRAAPRVPRESRIALPAPRTG